LNTLWWFYNLEPSNDDENINIQIGNGLRMYLEVVRDIMRLRLLKKNRENIFNKHNVADVIEKIKNIRTCDFQDDILMKVVLLYISYLRDRLKNKKKIVEETMKIFNTSYYTNNWQIAGAVGRLLINLSFLKGLVALIRVEIKLVQRGQLNFLKQSLAVILNRITMGLFPWITIGILDGPILYRYLPPIRNCRYHLKLGYWKRMKDRNKIIIN
jgi:hypothetical protein